MFERLDKAISEAKRFVTDGADDKIIVALELISNHLKYLEKLEVVRQQMEKEQAGFNHTQTNFNEIVAKRLP